MNETARVRLRGRDYMLRSQGDPEQIRLATRLVEEKLAEMDAAVAVDTHDRFMLAMLNLAGEALRERSERERLAEELHQLRTAWHTAERELAQRSEQLIEKIEKRLLVSALTEGE